MNFRKNIAVCFYFWILFVYLGCGLKVEKSSPNSPTATSISPLCAPTQLSKIATDQGIANVFITDPISSSGNLNLTPLSSQLDQYTTPVTLTNLSGLGVLDGKYVSILNRVNCAESFGAYNQKNQFHYPHSDFRFQEAMSYYFGDNYQSRLMQNGYLASHDPVIIFAHCESVDNSYFTKAHDTSGKILQGREFNEVCLGDSNYTVGAFYADDAQVVVHELQHAATVDNYSTDSSLNQFYYDEAGALNEGISDFMSLAFSDNLVPSTFSLDPKLFSRWALGTFNPKPLHSSVRGAHRCPMYDSTFPNCSNFPNFKVQSEGSDNTVTVSYVYPDGLGWPYPNNYVSQNPIASIYQSFLYDEEIHNDDLIIVGALWDVYSALKKNYQGDSTKAFSLSQKLVLEAVKHLPTPTVGNRSPVNFIQFGSKLVNASTLLTDFTSADQLVIQQALADRGLFNAPTVQSSGWLEVGPGTSKLRPTTPTAGVYIQDNPVILKKWLTTLGSDPSVVTQGLSTGLNSMLDPGEVAVIWFDIQNSDDVTAGGVLLNVTLTDPDVQYVQILNEAYNVGYATSSAKNQTQIMYGKIYGKTMGTALNSMMANSQPNSIYVTQGNTYFTTDPLFSLTYRTGIWVKVSPTAPHGQVVNFQVQAIPANASQFLHESPAGATFSVTIN